MYKLGHFHRIVLTSHNQTVHELFSCTNTPGEGLQQGVACVAKRDTSNITS